MPLNVLITTPDYPPKIGGLSTFSRNIESALATFCHVDKLVWSNPKDLSQFKFSKKYDYIVNVHFFGGFFLKNSSIPHINFIHGSEITFYSPNFLKRILKKTMKHSFLRFLEESEFNISISCFTQEKLISNGLKANYSRDFVLHNLIALAQKPIMIQRDWSEEALNFVCIARDVPHKNIDGAISWCGEIANALKRRVVLTINAHRTQSISKLLELKCIPEMKDDQREDEYQKAHFNLMPSLDHSSIGFFEGFGLTVLESGKYGTPSIVWANHGGQSESVHDNITGLVITDLSDLIDRIKNIHNTEYQKLRERVYQHTTTFHDAQSYQTVFMGLMK